MNVGENIKRIRKEKGLTQKELGVRLGVTQAAVGQFESTESNLKMETIKKIAEALKVDYTRLIIETPFSSGSKEEREKMNLEELVEYLSYSATSDPLKKQEILEQRERRIQKSQNNTVVINDNVDTSHPFYLLQEKLKRGEGLTDEEEKQYLVFLHEAEVAFSESLQRLGTAIRTYYELLNANGQKEADEEIERTIKRIEMLTKISEYQKRYTPDDED